MSLFAKIMVVVNLIFAVMFLASAGTFLGAAEDWKGQHDALNTKLSDEIEALKGQVSARQTQIDSLSSEKGALEAGKADAEGKLSVTQTSNKTLNDQNAQLQESLKTLATAQEDLQSKLAGQQTEIGRLNESLSNETSKRRDGETQIASLQENLARETQAREDAEASQAAAEARVAQLAQDLSGMETTIAIYQKEYGAVPGAKSMKMLDGVIQAVNNAEDIFVVSIGSKDGVQVGDTFTVSRGSEYVNEITIDKVFDNYASARSKRGMKKMDVKAGDSITNKW